MREAERTTREWVARSILEHGPSTASQLAERLDLTPAAVRRHLAVLEESGDLRSEEERIYGSRGRGRPAKVFLLTDAGRAHFPSTYDTLAIQALRQLKAVGGEPAIEQFAEERIADVVGAYRAAVVAAEDAGAEVDPPEALAVALNAAGYVATTQPSRTGEQLCQHHCPVAHVAIEFPELCAAETKVFSRLLGVHVQRLATIADGNGVCTTHIPDAVTTATRPRTGAVASHSRAPLTVVTAPAARTTPDATHQEG
ncbi:Predicted transcriptional regulator, ArsR family [Raineyella antarctica]|uniref:Predicted transcriptional regulator, ArsR family n=1 Tax=Raineyella antarctica TaxID=1577474 RepID=A0A1G6H131_9ACTN|nr:Predicted transcriptional regulator, ArsR family [Raineyella antarctica]